jgi:hypothetical protein
MSARLKMPLLFNTPPDEKPLTLDEYEGWAARAGAYIDGLTEIAHAKTGNEDGTGKLPFDVVRATITRGKDDFTAARVLLSKERK